LGNLGTAVKNGGFQGLPKKGIGLPRLLGRNWDLNFHVKGRIEVIGRI